MPYLIAASLIWALSFGLTKTELAGLSPVQVTVTRLLFASVLLLPWSARVRMALFHRLQLLGVGALQFGVMYLALNASYAYLEAHEVALYTVTTPLYLWLLESIRTKGFGAGLLVLSSVSVLAAAIVLGFRLPRSGYAIGVALLQVSNLAFGAGQLAYRKCAASQELREDAGAMGTLYVGGLLVSVLAWPVLGAPPFVVPTFRQGLALAFLGLIASGVGFYLWNAGARRVAVATLSVLNNAKIPAAVLVSLLIFGKVEGVLDLVRPVLAAGLIVAATKWAERTHHG